MENQENKIHPLDVFELLRSEVDVILGLLARLPYQEVAGVVDILRVRPSVRPVSAEQLAAIDAEIAKRAEEASKVLAAQAVNVEAQADMSEAAGIPEEEKTTEQ